jgi:hypothetical protein
MGHFALTCPFELSNEAFETTTAIVLGYPVPHARFLRTHVQQYPDMDNWADRALNSSAHASNTRRTTHDRIAQELAHIATQAGIPATSIEHNIPYLDEISHKRADLMTLTGGIISDNSLYGLSSRYTRLIMDVRLGHVFTTESHHVKEHTLREMERDKRRKYTDGYLRQGYAFAPMVANTWGQMGPDLLRFLWALANYAAHQQTELLPIRDRVSAPRSGDDDETRQRSAKILRGRLYHDYRLRMLTVIYESVAERVFGRTFGLVNNPLYRQWSHSHEVWSPVLHNLP